MPTVDRVPIFTIGYGAREIDAFIAALQQQRIEFLLDVRSRPYSRYKPDFSKDALEAHLRRAGIRYVFLGDALGGRPADPTCYDADGKVVYAAVEQRAFYREGLARVAHAYELGRRVALMCSEGKPEMCHRSKLIGKSLSQRGIPVAHIDEHDELVSQEDVLPRLTGGQLSFFGDDMLPGGSRQRYERPTAEEEEDE
jgi:uncharacterized protein (DUF488 family)